MRFTTKTEYGLMCLIYMARQYGTKAVITTKEIMEHEKYPRPFLEKIMQALRQGGIVTASAGKGGGYSLARRPADINLKEVIEALEGATFDVFCDGPTRERIVCTHLCLCGIKPVWKKTREILDEFYENITLQTLATNEGELQNVTLVTERN